MSILSRFRILPKILAVIALLSLIAGAINVLGVTSLKSLSDATGRMETVADQDLPIEHFEWTKTALQRDNAPGTVGKLRHRSCSFQLRRAVLRLRLRSFAFRTLYDQRAEVGTLCPPTRGRLDTGRSAITLNLPGMGK